MVSLALWLCVGACGYSGSAAENVVTPARRTATPAEVTAVANKLEVARDYKAEGLAFDKFVTAGTASEVEVRAKLGVSPDRWYRWTAESGEFRAAEYDIRGLKPGCPFFEAFAHVYESPAFGVFYKHVGGTWVAIDGGFHTKGTFKAEWLERGLK